MYRRLRAIAATFAVARLPQEAVFEPVRRCDQLVEREALAGPLAMESPMWVWALTNAGRITSSESTLVSSIRTISSSATMTRPSTGSNSGPTRTVPFKVHTRRSPARE